MDRDFWIYLLYCSNNTYYCGYTTNLKRRYKEHLTNTGKCKYTCSFKPLYLAQSWQVKGTKSLVMKIEKFIKKLSRFEKQNLVMNPNNLRKMLLRSYGSDLSKPLNVLVAMGETIHHIKTISPSK